MRALAARIDDGPAAVFEPQKRLAGDHGSDFVLLEVECLNLDRQLKAKRPRDRTDWVVARITEHAERFPRGICAAVAAVNPRLVDQAVSPGEAGANPANSPHFFELLLDGLCSRRVVPHGPVHPHPPGRRREVQNRLQLGNRAAVRFLRVDVLALQNGVLHEIVPHAGGQRDVDGFDLTRGQELVVRHPLAPRKVFVCERLRALRAPRGDSLELRRVDGEEGRDGLVLRAAAVLAMPKVTGGEDMGLEAL